jgi:hypothetical protein
MNTKEVLISGRCSGCTGVFMGASTWMLLVMLPLFGQTRDAQISNPSSTRYETAMAGTPELTSPVGETIEANNENATGKSEADDSSSGSNVDHSFVARPEPEPTNLTFLDRLNIFARIVISPPTALGPALGAGMTQWQDEPPKWGQGAKGYGRRFASGYARNLIWLRTRHAIAATFVAQRQGGGRMPAISNLAGIYGASFISNAWYPNSRADAASAFQRGSTALASNIAYHLLLEFWPEMKRALHIKAEPNVP